MPHSRARPLPQPETPHGSRYSAVIFDMDGVVTDTASVHAAAWKALFDEVLPGLGGPPQQAFDADDDYRRYVDGRTREDGVRSFLAARKIELPEGTVGDTTERATVSGLALRKQQFFESALAKQGVRVFPDAAALLNRLRADHVASALVTSSRNSSEILEAAGIAHLFDVRVDGNDAVALSLPGKPDPAMFLEAARRLGVEPATAVVLEDATSGVGAAASGGFGLVVGVDRTATGDQLLAAGADVVLTDLATLDLSAASSAHRGNAMTDAWCGGAVPATDGWLLAFDDFDPVMEGMRETLCTLGSGYWATRGSVPGAFSDSVHNPGTYCAGVYNRLVTDLAGRPVETEHLVAVPDWTFITVRVEDGPVFAPGSSGVPGAPELLSHRQTLDLRRGVLTRTDRYRDAAGRTTLIVSRHLQSLFDPRLAAIDVTVVAENWSGTIVVESSLNGRVSNRNVVADRSLAAEHLMSPEARELTPETVLLETRTNQSHIGIALAARTRFRDPAVVIERRFVEDAGRAGHETRLRVDRGAPITFEKVVTVATSRDRAQSTPGLNAVGRISRAPDFEELLLAQVSAWDELWSRFGVSLGAGERESLAVNLHIFHVLQTVGAEDQDLDVGVPARGLHGEGYRGHIFWDELFVYPMLTLRRPSLTRALLLYRYRRLAEARAAATAAGLKGAMFPWQSGSDGREETPTELFNTRSGTWMPDNSHRQRHVGLAVAYSVWQYYQATGDDEFLARYGAEMLVEVARLFVSLAVHDDRDDRFDIPGVMGPDEFHDGYPEAPGAGVVNNAYTNVLASWVLSKAIDCLERLQRHDGDRLRHRLRVRSDELLRWDHISRRLRVHFLDDGVISQFKGYNRLAEFDWDGYRRRYDNIGRLDLILQAEGDSTNSYRLSKQADALMLFYLFSAEELAAVFDRLGYPLPPDAIPRTIDFYLSRTSHGSTLSRLAHSWVLARGNREKSWSLFQQALDSDLSDSQGGSTREGIHLGAMAGTVDMIIRCYAGVETRDDALWLHPVLPVGLAGVSFDLSYRGQPITVELTPRIVRLRLHPCLIRPITVCIDGVRRTIGPGETIEVPLQ
ncbi:MAG: beta-phosphoglucomutase family hydrolase [Actinomycetota bacterium]